MNAVKTVLDLLNLWKHHAMCKKKGETLVNDHFINEP